MSSPLWMLMATGCFTLMALIIKLQSARFGVGDLLFLRLAFSAAWVLLLQPFARFDLRTNALGMHARRAAFGCLAMGAWYHTLAVLPMGISVTLNYMSPLFLALLLRLDKNRLAASPTVGQAALLGAGFVGVLVMMNPFGAPAAPGQAMAFVIGIAGALFGAMAFKDVKALKSAGQNEWQMVFYFSLLGALMALPFARVLHTPSSASVFDVLLLALAGLLGALGQLGVSKAFGRGDPMVPASLQYMSVVFSIALGWLVFHEQVTLLRLSGMALVIAAAIGSIALGTRKRSG
ncbi:MAG: DMT family transporter [Hydrogenophaga sp.]|nr:DMT family transporter [Hydrogenophaga sp.]